MANVVSRFLGSMLGSAAGTAASAVDPVNAAGLVLNGVKGMIGMFKLSPEVKAQLEAQLTLENVDLEKAQIAAELAAVQGQLDANKVEAASTSIFVSGWRPGVGWVCVAALAWVYLFQPFLTFFLLVFHRTLPANLPALDTGTLISGLLIPLLGLAALRTVEKVQGVAATNSTSAHG